MSESGSKNNSRSNLDKEKRSETQSSQIEINSQNNSEYNNIRNNEISLISSIKNDNNNYNNNYNNNTEESYGNIVNETKDNFLSDRYPHNTILNDNNISNDIYSDNSKKNKNNVISYKSESNIYRHNKSKNNKNEEINGGEEKKEENFNKYPEIPAGMQGLNPYPEDNIVNVEIDNNRQNEKKEEILNNNANYIGISSNQPNYETNNEYKNTTKCKGSKVRRNRIRKKIDDCCNSTFCAYCLGNRGMVGIICFVFIGIFLGIAIFKGFWV